jgi:outer membrane receptor protein involved in Fe transport
MLNAVLATRVQTLLNAADGGKSLCAGGFNPFGTANAMAISAACRDYMTATVTSTEDVGQRIAEASVQGSLAELPAGDLQFSASANYRKNTYNFTPDAQQLATNVLSVGGALRSSGSTAVKEAAGELRVPLLKEAPLAKALATSLGYRLSDYDHAGRQSTYKVDLEWTPLDNVLVRGGLQHAIRAPNVGELFSATVAGQFNFGTPPVGGEPCDVRGAGRTGANAASLRALCLATGVPASVIDSYTYPTTAAGAFSSGNVNLRPEVANTRTIGLVLTPRFAAPLFNQVSLSVDYYNIKIADTISAVPAAAALNKCYNMDGSNPSYSPSNPFCQLIVRDANGLLNQVNAPFLNLGKLQTAGVDLQLDWRFKLSALGMAADAGSFGINTAANVMNSYRAQALPGDALQEFRGTVGTVVRPRWQSVTTFRYEFGSGSVALRWRHLPAMRDITAVTRPASPTAGVARYDIADLSGHVGLGEHTDLRFGITNLFNRDPNLVPGSQNLTLPATYDIVGRSYFVGLREKF